MQVELFTGTPFAVHAWGLMLVLGFGFAMWVGASQLAAAGLPARPILHIGMVSFVAGVFGGRLLHAAEHGRLVDAFDLANDGMTSFGGLGLGVAAALGFCWLRGFPVARAADRLAVGVPVGIGFGRLGCWFNGCCYGAVCDPALPWAARFPAFTHDVLPVPYEASTRGVELAMEGAERVLASTPLPPMHPAQLYGSLAAMGVFVALSLWVSRKRAHGEVALALGMLYGLTRYGLELLRADTEPTQLTGLTLAQNLSLAVALPCLGGLVYLRLRAGPAAAPGPRPDPR